MPAPQFPDRLQNDLSGIYRLDSELDGGGMARVFVAEEKALRRKVVIKALSPDLAAGVSSERFRREIELAASLQHPNIVPLFSAGDAGGAPYYTMPFVEGRSLRARFAGGAPFSIAEATSTLRDVARALAYAHSQGVVHRDIKPDNILLSGDVAVVADFGIAKALSAARTEGGGTLTGIGVAVGSPAYMSPEQASADPRADHRSDIYSFGCVAYEMLAGSPPFREDSVAKLLSAHLTMQPIPISRVRADCPEPLARLVMSCLEKEPSRRPAGARDVIAALAGSGEATVRRRPSRVYGIASGAVVAVVVVAYALWRPTKEEVQSLAVLAFDHPGADSAQEYLSDGVADEISSRLAQIPGVRIAARSSANAFKGKPVSPAEIGRTLSVRRLVAGSVRRLGENVSVRAELIDVADGRAVWSHNYERRTRDIIGLQEEIVSSIVAALRLQLGARNQRSAHQPETDVYDKYLRAKYLVGRGSEPDIRRAIALLQEAAQRDSMFAPLFSALAWAHMNLADAYEPPRTMYPKAREFALRARVLDPAASDPLTMLGNIDIQFDYAGEQGRARLDSALARNPSDATAHFGLAIYWGFLARDPERSLREAQAATAADPLNPFVHYFMAWCAAFLGQLEDASRGFQRMQELAPGFLYLEPVDAEIFLRRGQLDSSLAANRRGETALGFPPPGLVTTLVRLGRRDEAQSALERMQAASQRRYLPPEQLARAYAAVGNVDKAFAELERGREARSAYALLTPHLIEFEVLRSDPRWTSYLTRIGLLSYVR